MRASHDHPTPASDSGSPANITDNHSGQQLWMGGYLNDDTAYHGGTCAGSADDRFTARYGSAAANGLGDRPAGRS